VESFRLAAEEMDDVSTTGQPASTPALHDHTETDLMVSVVIPCLNEEENITACVVAARKALDDNGLTGEVVVVDNASEDR
jgi:hypothetical protein